MKKKEFEEIDSLKVINTIRDVIRHEANAISGIVDTIDDSYLEAIKLILESKGKVVITGMGKSGHIARKISATMNSTGTPSVFLHPAEASHGDLGIISKDDVVIAIGKSGESDELNSVLPVIKRIGANIIGITANIHSTLASHSDVVLCGEVDGEACPHNLAPTTSTAVALAIGDALAVTLMQITGFKIDDFALYHPGGRLGRRLLLKVDDLLIGMENCPVLNPQSATIKDVIVALSSYGFGIVLFSTDRKSLDGIITDGDIRRLLEKYSEEIFKLKVLDVLNSSPFTVQFDIMAVDALKFMEDRESPLNVVPVLNSNLCVGIIRLHELLRVA